MTAPTGIWRRPARPPAPTGQSEVTRASALPTPNDEAAATSAAPRSDRFGPAFPQVLAAAQADAPWAYRRLFDWLGPPVAGYLRGQAAEDPDGLANDVFLRAFAKLRGFSGEEDRFRSWIFTIAHNQLIDERRRRRRRPVVDDRPGEGQHGAAPEDTEAEALQRLGGERVRCLLAGLSPDQRDVLLLRIVADLTVEQVARTVGKTPGAVKQLQRRGLAVLRRRLEDEAGGPASGQPRRTGRRTPAAPVDVHPPG